MIISLNDAKMQIEFKDWTDEKIKRKLAAIEQTIRKYTNNNFQNRFCRAECNANGHQVYGNVPGLKVGDTIQISQSMFNNGLYVVDAISDGEFTIDKELTEEPTFLVTKIEYPADVVDCCLDLLEWSAKFGAKVGVKSETLSRHSVTYEDSGTLFNGFPVGILNGLKLYKKARC